MPSEFAEWNRRSSKLKAGCSVLGLCSLAALCLQTVRLWDVFASTLEAKLGTAAAYGGLTLVTPPACVVIFGLLHQF